MDAIFPELDYRLFAPREKPLAPNARKTGIICSCRTR